MPPAGDTTPEARAWRLSPTVALRPEPFGALAYDFATRRLTFLKTPQLVDVVRRLADSPDMAGALRDAGVTDAARPGYVDALAGLARTGIIQER
jgi:putative mycofactocin binding protein MftB